MGPCAISLQIHSCAGYQLLGYWVIGFFSAFMFNIILLIIVSIQLFVKILIKLEEI